MQAKDTRISKLKEAIAGIKIVKCMAWEPFFERRIAEARRHEVLKLFYSLLCYVVIFTIFLGVSTQTHTHTHASPSFPSLSFPFFPFLPFLFLLSHASLLLLSSPSFFFPFLFLFFQVPLLLLLAIFGCYVTLGNRLTAVIAFPAISILNQLRVPLTQLPDAVSKLAEMTVSLKRIGRLLHAQVRNAPSPPLPFPPLPFPSLPFSSLSFPSFLDPTHPHAHAHTDPPPQPQELPALVFARDAPKPWTHTQAGNPSPPSPPTPPTKEGGKEGGKEEGKEGSTGDSVAAVSIDGGSFSYGGDDAVLVGVSVEVGVGEFVAVGGRVGSGKTSLLLALLGEMRMLQGSYTIRGAIAYVAQTAFILNGTVRDNILFGR